MNWYVLYVKSRAEKKVATRLGDKGFDVFCPTRKVIRQWTDRKKEIEQPYFSCYVFVRFGPGSRITVLETPGVVNIVHWLGRPAIIRDEEMKLVIDFFRDHSSSGIEQETLREGCRVMVTEGLLKDREGIVIRKNKRKVILEITDLGIAFKAEIAKEKVVSMAESE